MKPPRGLTTEEATLWRRVTASVTPLERRRPAPPQPTVVERVLPGPKPQGRVPAPLPPAPAPKAAPAPGLDATWERKLARAAVAPDFTLDLHGHTLAQAHRRLDLGLAQASAQGARVVLLITGKPRPADPADRGTQRGAIRAKVVDWLAAGPHAGSIAAIRPAHRRHGGEGALYLVLRRAR